MFEPKPLHFVTLLGSLRHKSYNAAIARSLPSLAREGVTITALGSVGTFPLYDEDVQAAGFPAEVTAMGEAIRLAGGVIIVTPEYNYSVPGGIKNALDWLSRLPNQPFAGKPVAQYHLRQILVYLDAAVLNKPEVMIGHVAAKVHSETLELTDADTRHFLEKQVSAFAHFAQRYRVSG